MEGGKCEFEYKCRPGYGSKKLLIEIDGAEDEFFIQEFMNVISEIHPISDSEITLSDMMNMLEHRMVQWSGSSDAGRFSIDQDQYGTAFILSEGDENVILGIDRLLKQNPRFRRVDVNFDDYKIAPE